jgi:pimeloyl-ACP methyl ester carboxylesterase
MKRSRLLLWVRRSALISIIIATPTLGLAASSSAEEPQVKTTFARLGPGVPGVLYEPAAPGPKSQIAVLVMHSGGDFLNHTACMGLSTRGYRVLCANNSASKSGFTDDESTDRMVLDAKLAVAWLRKYPGVKKIVLLGHSGGGTLMSTYQDIAENGVSVCQDPDKLIKCPDTLAGMPPADGVMLIDSNFGLPGVFLFSLDPAVVNEDNGTKLNPELDNFNPKNGFNPAGSDYSEAFIHRWQSAVGKRNTRLVSTALDRMALIEAGKGRFSDDEPMVIPGGNFRGHNNRFYAQDPKLMSHTRKEWPLLLADGATQTAIVHSVRVPENGESHTASLDGGGLQTSVRKFLETYAVRVTDDFGYDADTVRGVDWKSSYAAVPGNVEGIKVPLLTMGMTGHWEFMSAETIYDHAKSSDKTLVYVQGALHGYTTCKKCEKTPGEFGDTQKTTYDYVDSWLSKPGRFLPQ